LGPAGGAELPDRAAPATIAGIAIAFTLGAPITFRLVD